MLARICAPTDDADDFLSTWRDSSKPLALDAHEMPFALEALLDTGWIELHPANAVRFRLTASGQRRCAQLPQREAAKRATV